MSKPSIKTDLGRIAEALEGIEVAAMVMAGLWDRPEAEDTTAEQIDRWECICGANLVADRSEPVGECPNCHTKWEVDESGGRKEKA